MKAIETEPRTLDDLIFENRNHEYGAYAVRKAYPSAVNRATTLTLGLAAAIAAYSFVATNKHLITEVLPNTPTTTIGDPPIILPTPPPPTPIDPVRVQHTRGDLPPVATPEPVVETISNTEVNLFQGGGEDGNVDENLLGSTSGAGTDVAIEVPPAVDENIYDGVVEVAASYKGGMEAMFKFISKNVKYPAIARRLDIDGTVYVSFVVGKSGEILDAKVIKGIHPSCDAEALRVINLLKEWSPGRQGGQPVKVRMVIPIKFLLNR